MQIPVIEFDYTDWMWRRQNLVDKAIFKGKKSTILYLRKFKVYSDGRFSGASA